MLRRDAERYGDGVQTVTAEQRAERHGIMFSAETLRGELLVKDVPASGLAGTERPYGDTHLAGRLTP